LINNIIFIITLRLTYDIKLQIELLNNTIFLINSHISEKNLASTKWIFLLTKWTFV
jgi:hypothetical protein